ncbi:hypothetical protein KCU61_g4, partial [Aureobasidium melanogenum]
LTVWGHWIDSIWSTILILLSLQGTPPTWFGKSLEEVPAAAPGWMSESTDCQVIWSESVCSQTLPTDLDVLAGPIRWPISKIIFSLGHT